MASKGVGEVKPVFQTPHNLFNHLQSASNLILVDTRHSEEYSLSSVRTSVNLDFVGKDGLESLKLYKGRFALRKYFNVFLYDDCDYLECGDKRGTAWDLLQLLIQEGDCKSPVYILESGFNGFMKIYPYLVRNHPLSVVDIFPAEIIHGKLYLGDSGDSKNKQTQELLGVKAVVNCTLDEEFSREGEENQFRVAVDDACDQNIEDYFTDTLSFMREHVKLGHTVLVHCIMGMSRSVSIVLLYLMHTEGLSLKESYDLVKSKRPCINPNPRFLKELSKRELELKGCNTIRFTEGEVLSVSSVYDWLIDGQWVPRTVLTKPK